MQKLSSKGDRINQSERMRGRGGGSRFNHLCRQTGCDSLWVGHEESCLMANKLCTGFQKVSRAVTRKGSQQGRREIHKCELLLPSKQPSPFIFT